jgi:hypothetical protein
MCSSALPNRAMQNVQNTDVVLLILFAAAGFPNRPALIDLFLIKGGLVCSGTG